KACPNASINILSTKNIAGKKVLGKYLYHLGSCTQCGLCVEACPFGAIRMNQEFELSNESVDSFEMTLNKKEGRG
ncbi:MAG TPA: 4Fe-4S dicluster domain-containing protein, partial [Fibrobacteraceae bacterium]|nr:4Fe-4S dicluster domain-containing protein [Fibrobacteraceae bacterium]